MSPPVVAPRPMDPRHPVYVWDVTVRVTHWLIALSIVVLAATGFYLGRPFIAVRSPAEAHFVTGTIKVIHSYTAVVFTLAVLARIVWMFLGSRYARWDQLVPVAKQRRHDLVETFKFYTFLRKRPPDYPGHNPLAGVAYVAVFGLYLLMMVTGTAIYSASASLHSPMHALQFLIRVAGGLSTARWLHHVGMWLLLAFAVHHVYSVALTASVERNGEFDSIVTGYKTSEHPHG